MGKTRGGEYRTEVEVRMESKIKSQVPWNIHVERGAWQLDTQIWRWRQIRTRDVDLQSLDSWYHAVFNFKLQAKGCLAEYSKPCSSDTESFSMLCSVFHGNTEASHFQRAMKPTISLLANYSEVNRNGLWACNVLGSYLSLIYG